MQEEVENRTVSFVVSSSKMSLRVILAAIRKVLQARGYYRQQKKTERRQIRTRVKVVKKEAKAKRKAEGPRGKQSVRQLVRHSNGVTKLTIESQKMREFEKILKKYGVDYSFMQDVRSSRPQYLFFFKARDQELLKNVYDECFAKQLDKDGFARGKRPSLLAALAHFKAIAAQQPQKARHHEQEHSL